MTLDEIRIEGLKALERHLGPEGMIRFLQQFETGRGDYTMVGICSTGSPGSSESFGSRIAGGKYCIRIAEGE